ncbi:MAG: response regulator [Clostridiales bacterium]|nr:response regulator [Clostridiales bacterium]
MKKVLIVDDETIVRMTLRSLIDWESLGYTVVADARNGEHALQLMREQPVDLLITDMKMPVLDGLGLMEALSSEVQKLPQILVLSGYDDFQLVREAFRLGAFDYLLKSDLNAAVLTDMLQKLSREAFPNEEPSALSVKKPDTCDTAVLLGEMAAGKRPVDRELLSGNYLIVQFEIDHFYREAGRFTDQLEESLINPLLGFAGQIPRVASRCILGSISASRYLMLYRVADPLQYQQNVISTCRQLCNVWNNYMNLHISAGISSLGNCPEDFPNLLEEAENLLHLRFLNQKNQILSPWDEGLISYSSVCEISEQYPDLFRGLLTGDELAVDEARKQLFSHLYTGSLDQAKETVLALICQLAWKLVDNNDSIHSIFMEEINYYEKLRRLDEIPNLELWLNNYFRWVLDYIQHTQDRHQADLMSRAKRFILDNYANPELTLGIVAGFVGLNEKYFSTRFTKEEGTTFSNYLTEVRIRKARELMSETNMKIYEVSQSVGYNSVEHFTRVFKKICKVSPRNYRK